MSLRISTNIAALAAARGLSQSQRALERSMKQLASGSRFSDASVGAGEFAISERLRGQISGVRSGRNNADFASYFVAIAEGGLSEQNNTLVRMRELAIQAASDTLSDQEKEFLDFEFQNLSQEVDRIAQTTRFGSQRLLMGDGSSLEVQGGPYKGEENLIRYRSQTNTSSRELDIDGLRVRDKDSARDSLEVIDEALVKIGGARAYFAAVSSRLQAVSANAAVQLENLSAAQSRLADTDIAEAVSEMTRHQILQQFQTSVLAQANQIPSMALKLL
ncbi:MAG: flagellin [Bdellovibrio sp.]